MTIDVAILKDRKLSIKNRKFAGVQGDIASAKISFDVTEVQNQGGLSTGYARKWRVEFKGCAGTFETSIPLEPNESNKIEVSIPNSIYDAGGTAQVYLIEEVVNTSNEVTTRVCSYPLRLYLNNKPTGKIDLTVDEYERNLTDMYLSVSNKADTVIQYADEIANKSDIGHKHTSSDVTDFAQAVDTQTSGMAQQVTANATNILQISTKLTQDEGTIGGLGTAVNALSINKQNKTDDGLQTTDKTVVGAINEVKDDTTALFDNTFTLSRDKQDKTDEALILDDNLDGNVVLAIKNTRTRLDVAGSQLSANKQDKTDINLETTDKTVVGAINEVDSELSQLNSTVDDMGRQVGANSTAISDINGEVSELKEDLSDLSEIVHFPITSNPFTQENYFSKSTGIELHYTDDGFALSTSGINGIFCFNIGNLVVGNTYELSFNIPADDFYSVAIKGYSQSNVKGHFSYTFTADRGNESIQFSIWYTNNNFAVSNVKLKNLSEKPFLFEEIRAKEVETELQDQLDRKISKDDLTGVIKFAGEGINPFTQENYTYTGVNELDITFTDFGFEIPVAGINDSGIWFNVPTVIGGRYRIQFSVKTGVFNSINIDNVAVVPIDNVISYEFTATKQTTSIRFVIWYTSPSYIVTDAKLVDLDEKTGILSSSWYKDKKGVRLGDSITAQAEFWTSGNLQGSGWSTLVKDYFSCAEIVNCGIGGSTIAGTSVTNAMWTDARIDAIPTDCDFVLFMGGTNDWSQNVPIGDIDSTDTDTFYGALNVISQKLTARLPNANIIWMCNVYGKDTNKPEKNTVNLTLYDYSRAFIASADRNGFAVIDTYKAWNKYNCEPYLNAEGDGTVFIHPNVAGGKKMANLIINGMKFYEPVIS